PFRYTTTKKNLSPVIGLDGYRKIVDEVRKAGNELPIVAIGGITLDDIDDIMSTGVQGIAMAGSIINADDPVKYTEEVISRLKKGQQQ
ncbi:thiamine phosphate synthase, partial [Muribaculum sp.]